MNFQNDIDNLRVAHWSLPADRSVVGEAGTRAHVADAGLVLETCLRRLHIDITRRAIGSVGNCCVQLPADEHRTGAEAYRLLLEIAAGLRSAIPGETNVFGQFKNAWQAFREHRPPGDVARLAPLMHRLINDTKAIRAQHLQGIGGTSYGSLVRRLLKPEPADRILFVGAGNLAQSMLPLFRNFTIGLWNHRETPEAGIAGRQLFNPDNGRGAAEWADQLILTTPPDPANDRRWQRWIAGSRIRAVVHLGHRRITAQHDWGADARIFDLGDVLALQRAQATLRSMQLDQARAACRQRAERFASEASTALRRRPAYGSLNAA